MTTFAPIPLSSLRHADNGASKGGYLGLLGNLTRLREHLSGSSHIPASDRLAWIKVITDLSDHCLTPLPTRHEASSQELGEKIRLVEATLDVLRLATERIDNLLAGRDFTKKMFSHLVHLCNSLNAWMDTKPPPEMSLTSPMDLQSQVSSEIVNLVRSLGTCTTPVGNGKEPTWKIMRCIIQECLEFIRDSMQLFPTLTFPIAVRLFSKPRIQGGAQQPMSSATTLSAFTPFLEDSPQLSSLLGLLLQIVVSSLLQPLACQSLMLDLVRQSTELTASLLEFLMFKLVSPYGSFTPTGGILRVIAAISVILSSNTPFKDPVQSLPLRLLRYRLDQGPRQEYAILDRDLAKLFDNDQAGTPSKRDINTSIQFLRTEMSGCSSPGHSTASSDNTSLKILVLAFLRHATRLLGPETLQLFSDSNLVDFAEQLEFSSSRKLHLSDDRREARSWRLEVKAAVQEIILPEQISWMEDDRCTDELFTSRAFDDIRERALEPLTAAERQLRAEQIARLICLLSHPGHAACAMAAARHSSLSVSMYFPILLKLLDGSQNELHASARRSIYDTAARGVRHTSLRQEISRSDALVNFVMCGAEDRDRSVRLKAGIVLAELVVALNAIGPPARIRLQSIFDRLHRFVDKARDPVRETIILTLARIGRTTTGEDLGHIVFLLVTRLGEQNPVLKGTAYMQLLALAKHLNVTPYGLISPYMRKLAPFLLSRICLQPNLLAETCRFLSRTTTDFLLATLDFTMPSIFAQCESRMLEQVAKELDMKPSRLFVDRARLILADIFLLPSVAQTNQALKFVVQVVIDDSTDNRNVNVRTIVGGFLVPLLTELVVTMGHEDPVQADIGAQALQKVEGLMSTLVRGRIAPNSDIGTFLKGYMLGLITDINDMLRDVQGKKSTMSKRQILRGLGALISQVGAAVSNVAPQIMATLQTMLNITELAEVSLETWCKFLSTVSPSDIGPHVSPTTASIVSLWPSFDSLTRKNANMCLELLIGPHLGKHLDDVADLSAIPELRQKHEQLATLRSDWTAKDKLQKILERSSSDNLTVSLQAFGELKHFMLVQDTYIRALCSGDMFEPVIGRILVTLFAAACRDGDGAEALRLLAFECIGILGAVDPDRCEFAYKDKGIIMLHNFTDEGESVQFALHLIQDVLVGAFRSTSDMKYQSHLAYAIQELLRFCKFSPALVTAGSTIPLPLKVRNRWNSLPKHILETVTPLLEAEYTLTVAPLLPVHYPIYPQQTTYREWIQSWTAHLITQVSGGTAQAIFGVCRAAARNKDVAVARHLLPHLVLNILISGTEKDAHDIRLELLVVLQDQVNCDSDATDDKKLLSAQVVFNLLDHLNKWIRKVRQEIQGKKLDSKRSRAHQLSEHAKEQLSRVDSILSSIDQNLMAKAALQCKAHARALMNFEQLVLAVRERSPGSEDLPSYYERLHEIYAHLDEPDGMEGVSTLILSPSLEHQIRQHESTGRWTSAQSCWEVRLQQSPDNLDFHLGLLRCLRNLGHYDTLRTHVKGVLTRNPGWQSALAGFQVESAWMVGAWDDVQHLTENKEAQSSSIVMARLLLAMRTGNVSQIAEAFSAARRVLGIAITASGVAGYRRCYDAVLDLHLTHELEMIHTAISSLTASSRDDVRRQILADLSQALSARLNAVLPNFRIREPVLSMRRTAFALNSGSAPQVLLEGEIGRSWLASAKIARKAGRWQTAYSAMLQAQQNGAQFAFIESAKLVKSSGEPLRALQELENAMGLLSFNKDDPHVIDLTDDEQTKKMEAKAQVLRARWMNESERFEMSLILRAFQNASDTWQKWESGHYHLGQFHDECFKSLTLAEQSSRGTKMNLYTVRFFARAIKYGTKYVYQTIPRLLTIWLDMGENEPKVSADVFAKLNNVVAKAIKETPAYKWYIAFPQIVSRVGHTNATVYSHLSKLIIVVLQEYPAQALWLFTSVVKSTKVNREQRGKQILDQLRNHPQNRTTVVPELVNQCLAMTNELLALCDYPIDDDSKRTLTMSRDFPKLAALGCSKLIIPLQESLTANLPPTSSSSSVHQPFPPDAPTFAEFADEVEVMRSLAKPRKITIRGSNGHIYMFLGKPKDDLRKDARLMDFNSIINKLLKANSESRRRQLHIRTYGVVTLNEECGFIQWVPNTIPIRPVLLKGYESRGIKSWSTELGDLYKKSKDLPDKEAGQIFVSTVLPMYPPVFHEWFIETFPEPSAWLASRLTYGRTAAVMSMVGFILGLGDRHSENIILDTNTGDVIHVDFNCLFEKGKTLETPERIPFRLTQNMVDGLGVTGVEGVFRIACEVTLQLLRDNKDSLMSVLDAFTHDPLVEWEDEKRKMERDSVRKNSVKPSVDLRMLATSALNPIGKKLRGIYSTSKDKHEKEISTSNLVQMLIQEATNPAYLWKMYPGWASWY